MKFQAARLSSSIFSVSQKMRLEHYNSQATKCSKIATCKGRRGAVKVPSSVKQIIDVHFTLLRKSSKAVKMQRDT